MNYGLKYWNDLFYTNNFDHVYGDCHSFSRAWQIQIAIFTAANNSVLLSVAFVLGQIEFQKVLVRLSDLAFVHCV